MKIRHTITVLSILFSHTLADEFQPNPAWVIDPHGKSGYTVYDSYNIVSETDTEDPEGIVRFSNRIWRGTSSQFLENRIKEQTLYGRPCVSSVLLKNDNKWIELGRATVQASNINFHQAFLFYEWDVNSGGIRKSSFFVKDELGTLKLGEVIEIGNSLALIKVGVGINDWVNLIIVDLNTFRPKGIIEFSDLEITSFTKGQTLKIRYKDPVSRAQLLSDENAVCNLPWTEVDVVTDGVLNPVLIDEEKFQISIPAAQ
jgi:hypothetical protein